MKPWINRLLAWFRMLITNIAFIPTVMVVCSLIFAIGMQLLENAGYTDWVKEELGFALVKGSDNARMLLTTVIGGILSLTVFSFSMVMVVLNRASASLSPRVLPQLIAHKPHQIVLGFYMGTIVYSLIIVINISKEAGIPSFSILVSMILAIASLGLFIYFIHSISQSIQVANILSDIFNDTKRMIETMKMRHASSEVDPKDFKNCLEADRPGYYKFIPGDKLLSFFAERPAKLMICPYPTQFIAAKTPILKMSCDMEDVDNEWLENSVIHSEMPFESEQFLSGFLKISEIGVKALSPGINDPGTAVRALRVLAVLFTHLYPYPKFLGRKYNYDSVVTLENLPDLKEVHDTSILPIRHCVNGEKGVAIAIVNVYETLLNLIPDDEKTFLKKQLLSFRYEFADQALNKQTYSEIDDRLKPLLVALG